MSDERPSEIVAIQPQDTAARSRLAALAQRLGVDLVDEVSLREMRAEGALRLAWADDRLELRRPDMRPGRGVCVDFAVLNLRPGTRDLSKKQPLARAFGPKVRSIIDATAGLGQDAFLLAALGYGVTAVERSPVLAALLEDGLRRASADATLAGLMGDRLRVWVGDSRTRLRAIDPPPDGVYVDPMFPPKRRASALPRKEIQVIRVLVGDDPDAADLCRVAREVASQRVVVKRPDHAEPLAGPPDHVIESKLARFDVYVKR